MLLRKIGLPDVVANAIQEKLRREQESEQMKFVLQKERRRPSASASRRRGSRTSSRSWRPGISPQLLEWKGIEATEKLAMSQNSKVVVIGNGKNGLPDHPRRRREVIPRSGIIPSEARDLSGEGRGFARGGRCATGGQTFETVAGLDWSQSFSRVATSG